MLAAAMQASGAEDCPVSLTLRVPASDIAAADRYAACMAEPHLPLADALAGVQQRCRAAVPDASAQAVAWVDHIAHNAPGCETRMRFTRG